MSRLVREWLIAFALFSQTTHTDRIEIDREIERRTGVTCDNALEKRMITETEFKEIVEYVLKKKKKKAEAIAGLV